MTLELIRDFVNTKDVDDGTDAVSTPAGLGEWLRGRGLLARTVRPTPADVERAAELREAFRALLLRNNGVEAEADTQALDRAARRARLALAFSPEGAARLEPRAGGVDAALGRIVAAVFTAQAEGAWPRLKACRARDCTWAFVDHARNLSRHWCSMRVCGNRQKARVYRSRHTVGDRSRA